MSIDTKTLLEEVKSNLSKLNGCTRHCFGELSEYKFGDLSKQMVCKNCGGSMRLQRIRTYQKGYADAGGNPLDILISDLDE